MRLRVLGSILAAAAIVAGSQLPVATAAPTAPVTVGMPDAAVKSAALSLWQQAVDTQTVPGGITWYVFGASISSAQEVPTNSSTATGVGVVAVTADLRNVIYVVTTNMTDIQGGHIHRAPAGVNGPVIYPFTIPASGVISGRSTFNSDDFADLSGGRMYINLHSTTYPGGEIRGQLISLGLFSVPDLGTSAPPAPVTPPSVPGVTLPPAPAAPPPAPMPPAPMMPMTPTMPMMPMTPTMPMMPMTPTMPMMPMTPTMPMMPMTPTMPMMPMTPTMPMMPMTPTMPMMPMTPTMPMMPMTPTMPMMPMTPTMPMMPMTPTMPMMPMTPTMPMMPMTPGMPMMPGMGMMP